MNELDPSMDELPSSTPQASSAFHAPLKRPTEAELAMEEAEADPHSKEAQPRSEEVRSVSQESSGSEAEPGIRQAESGREFALPEADSPFPPPGSSASEIFAWWGLRMLNSSRTFTAQREERTHRELLERLRQSLPSQNKASQTPAFQTEALENKAFQPKASLTQASPTEASLSKAGCPVLRGCSEGRDSMMSNRATAADTRFVSGPLPLTENLLTPTEHALAACLYLTIHCAKCENVRQGRPDYPKSSTMPCPQCGTESRFTVLGAGITRRPLPFYEVQKTDPFAVEGKPRIPWDRLGPLSRNRLKDGAE